MELQDKVAIVTGGGRGIGRGITDKLLAAGASVLIAQRKPLDEELNAEARVHWVEANLVERGSAEAIAEAAASLYDGVDVLVNNAGFMVQQGVDQLTEETWDRMMAVNLRAPAFLSKALLPLMRDRGGSIINIGSIEGLGANPEHAAYCSSKAGLHGLTRALAVDLGACNIRCNAIAPGWIETELSRAYIGSRPKPDEAHRKLLGLHPVGFTGGPDNLGDAVVFLASDTSCFITGQVLTVDGGRTAKLPLPF